MVARNFKGGMTMRTLILAAVVAAMAAGPVEAGTFRGPKTTPKVEFRADGSDSASLFKVENATALSGVTAVVIPQFTVEFVEATDGLGTTRGQNISVTYHLSGLDDAARQAITDRLYARFAASLQARGLKVLSPSEVAATAAWGAVAQNARTEPASLKRATLETRIFSAGGAPYLLPAEAQAAPGAGGQAMKTAGQGLAVGGMFSSRLAGAAGMMQGASALSKMGGGLASFGGALAYAKMEPQLATETGAAVMTVRLVVGLRETDKPSQLFASIRTASSLVGEPRLAVLSDGTALSLYAPNPKMTRTEVKVAKDLLISEDLLSGRTTLRNSAAGTASNLAARGLFLTSVVAGGGVDLYQDHHVDCAPEPTAFSAAVERNLAAASDLMLAQLP